MRKKMVLKVNGRSATYFRFSHKPYWRTRKNIRWFEKEHDKYWIRGQQFVWGVTHPVPLLSLRRD